ncbi:MAG: carbon-nitrogen hydrolase family protein [Phycisphaerae bacterium]
MATMNISGSESTTTSPASDGWAGVAVRDEISPRFFTAQRDGKTCLGIAGAGNDAASGCWRNTFLDKAVKPGKFYRFQASYLAKDVAFASRGVLARLFWLDAAGKQIERGEWPATSPKAGADGWREVGGVYEAPATAVAAQVELHLRWEPKAEVLWRGVELKETNAPKPRKVRLAALNRRPKDTGSPAKNLEIFANDIAEAAKLKPDIICLGEGITIVGTGQTFTDVAETIPGPTTKALGDLAARHKLYIAAGIYEREGKAIYNTCVLLGRDGKLVGKYRKACLPEEEIAGGLTAGRGFPVFETEFGRVGLMICWDLSYPEVAAQLASAGAEVILMPIWGGSEPLARARAIENQVYLVAAGYDFQTAIYDRTGKPLSVAERDGQTITADVDLAARTIWPWIGDWRSRIPREAPFLAIP